MPKCIHVYVYTSGRLCKEERERRADRAEQAWWKERVTVIHTSRARTIFLRQDTSNTVPLIATQIPQCSYYDTNRALLYKRGPTDLFIMLYTFSRITRFVRSSLFLSLPVLQTIIQTESPVSLGNGRTSNYEFNGRALAIVRLGGWQRQGENRAGHIQKLTGSTESPRDTTVVPRRSCVRFLYVWLYIHTIANHTIVDFVIETQIQPQHRLWSLTIIISRDSFMSWSRTRLISVLRQTEISNDIVVHTLLGTIRESIRKLSLRLLRNS